MKKILLRMRSGIVYSTEDYNIVVDSSGNYNSHFVNVLTTNQSFWRSYYNTNGTFYKLTDLETSHEVYFSGDNVESITVVK